MKTLLKKIMIVGIVVWLVLGLCGCSKKKMAAKGEMQTGEKKETKEGITQLTLEDVFAKIDRGDKFILLVTQSTCSYCNSFKKTLVPFLKEHADIPFYEIEVDMLSEKKADIEKNFAKLKEKIPEYSGATPMLLCYEAGKVMSSKSGEPSEAALVNLLIDCGYLQGEKRKEESKDDSLPESGHIKVVNVLEAAKKIQEKESFYLMVNQNDRYNQAFIKTLIPVLEKRNITIIALRFPLEDAGSKEELKQAYETVMECIMELKLSPAVFRIEKGTAEKLLEDNESKAEIEQALQ